MNRADIQFALHELASIAEILKALADNSANEINVSPGVLAWLSDKIDSAADQIEFETEPYKLRPVTAAEAAD